MKLLNWNCGSLTANHFLIDKALEQEKPDIFCLQEIRMGKKTAKFANYKCLTQNYTGHPGKSGSMGGLLIGVRVGLNIQKLKMPTFGQNAEVLAVKVV